MEVGGLALGGLRIDRVRGDRRRAVEHHIDQLAGLDTRDCAEVSRDAASRPLIETRTVPR